MATVNVSLRTAGKKVTGFVRRLASHSARNTVALLSLVGLAALCTLIWTLILRVVSPKSQITVAAFEMFVTDPKASTPSGKALADLVVDNLHRILAQAERYSGNAFSSRNTYAPVTDMPHIPVDTSYGIAIKGISVDVLLSTWNRLRYHEYLVSGDLFSASDTDSVIRMRYTGEGRASSFESYVRRLDPDVIQEAASDLALDLLDEINPEAAARYRLAVFYGCQFDCPKSLDNAIKFAEKWTNRDPENALSFFYLGCALMNTDHPADAIAFLDRAFELDNGLHLALAAKGAVLIGEGKYREAESAYKAALRIRTTPNPLMSLGVVASLQGQYQEAEGYYRKALAEDPRYVGAYLNLGGILLRMSKSADAVGAYRKARYLQPENTRALNGLVLSLVKDGKPDEALRECEQAARLEPDAEAPLVDEGIVYLRTGHTDQAIQQFKKVVVEKNSAEAMIQLGLAYFKQGHLDSALELFDSVLTGTPDSASMHSNSARIHDLIAKVLEAQGDILGSKRHADKSEQLMPGFKYVTLDNF